MFRRTEKCFGEKLEYFGEKLKYFGEENLLERQKKLK